MRWHSIGSIGTCGVVQRGPGSFHPPSKKAYYLLIQALTRVRSMHGWSSSRSLARILNLRRQEKRVRREQVQKIGVLPIRLEAIEQKAFRRAKRVNETPLHLRQVSVVQFIQRIGSGFSSVAGEGLIVGKFPIFRRRLVVFGCLRNFDLRVACHSFLPKLKADVLSIVRRKLGEDSCALLKIRSREFLEIQVIRLLQSPDEPVLQPPESLHDFWPLVREWIVQHPHSRGIAAAQAQVVHRGIIPWLRRLQLMKALVHQRDEPRRTRLRVCVCRLARYYHSRWTKSGKRCEKVRAELARSRINVFAKFGELRRRRRMVKQKFHLRRYEQEWRGRPAPAGPDLIADLGSKPVEFGDANHVLIRYLLGRGNR